MGYREGRVSNVRERMIPKDGTAGLHLVAHLFYHSSTLAFIVDHLLVLDVRLGDYQDATLFQCEGKLPHKRHKEMKGQKISMAARKERGSATDSH
jgi:hypothetical protein